MHPTSAHLRPLLPAVGLVALWELDDEVVRIGLPGRRLDLGITWRLNTVLGLHAVDDVAPGAERAEAGEEARGQGVLDARGGQAQ